MEKKELCVIRTLLTSLGLMLNSVELYGDNGHWENTWARVLSEEALD